MKKYYITFLIINIFGCAIAQSYTQSFNEVFQNVDLSQAMWSPSATATAWR